MAWGPLGRGGCSQVCFQCLGPLLGRHGPGPWKYTEGCPYMGWAMGGRRSALGWGFGPRTEPLIGCGQEAWSWLGLNTFLSPSVLSLLSSSPKACCVSFPSHMHWRAPQPSTRAPHLPSDPITHFGTATQHDHRHPSQAHTQHILGHRQGSGHALHPPTYPGLGRELNIPTPTGGGYKKLPPPPASHTVREPWARKE